MEASLEGCGRQHDRHPHRGRAECEEAADRNGGLAIQSRGASLFAGRSTGDLEGGDHAGDRERTRSPSSQAGKSPASSRPGQDRGSAEGTGGTPKVRQGTRDPACRWWQEQAGQGQEEQAARTRELIESREEDRFLPPSHGSRYLESFQVETRWVRDLFNSNRFNLPAGRQGHKIHE